MADEKTVGGHGMLWLFIIIVLGTITGNIITHWGHDAAQKYRLKRYVKNNPGAPIPVQMAGTIAAPAPIATAATAPAGATVASAPLNTGVVGPGALSNQVY